MFLLSVYTSKHLRLLTRIYIHRYILTILLKMTEVWSKRRVLPLIFVVKSFTLTLMDCLKLL